MMVHLLPSSFFHHNPQTTKTENEGPCALQRVNYAGAPHPQLSHSTLPLPLTLLFPTSLLSLLFPSLLFPSTSPSSSLLFHFFPLFSLLLHCADNHHHFYSPLPSFSFRSRSCALLLHPQSTTTILSHRFLLIPLSLSSFHMSGVPPRPHHIPLPPNAEVVRKQRLRGNILFGLLVTGCVAGIYVYTMMKVTNNDFKKVDDKGNVIKDE